MSAQPRMSLMLTTAALAAISDMIAKGRGREDIYVALRKLGHAAEPFQVREIVIRERRYARVS